MKKQTFGLPQVQRKISDQDLGVPFQLHQANAYTFPCPIAAAQDPSREHENANELQPCDWCQKWVLLHREGNVPWRRILDRFVTRKMFADYKNSIPGFKERYRGLKAGYTSATPKYEQ
jgi:hypothetical protein